MQNSSFQDLTTGLMLEALSDNIRSTFASEVVFDDNDLSSCQDWVTYCSELVEDINIIDNYLGPRLLQMPTHKAPQMVRLILNLGKLVGAIMRTCEVEFDIMDLDNRNGFLLDIEKRVNQLLD